MMQPLSLPQQIQANFPKVEASPDFSGERLWLTFYLWGQPENYSASPQLLRRMGGSTQVARKEPSSILRWKSGK